MTLPADIARCDGVSDQRKAFEAYLKAMPEWAPEFETHRAWVEAFAFWAWHAATRHAAHIALTAPVKTDRQDQREACANAILGGME